MISSRPYVSDQEFANVRHRGGNSVRLPPQARKRCGNADFEDAVSLDSWAGRTITFPPTASALAAICIVQQAARVSDQTAFFNLASQGKPGKLIEIGPTEKIFSNPDQKATEDYITGRFG